MKTDSLLNASIVILSLCAMVLTGSAVARARAPQSTAQPVTTKVANWRTLASSGQRMGLTDAPVTIVEFADFQCPFCRRTADALRAVRTAHGASVAVVYRHYPLNSIHPFAESAAIASECAAQQDDFESFHDALYAAQDSIGRLAWSTLATRAGVRDTSRFQSCLTGQQQRARVQEDVAAGESLHLLGTPTVLVNQYRINGAATQAVIDSLVRVVLLERHQ